jgi:hypothetical protein
MSHKKLLLTIFAISFSLLMLADDTLACSCLPSHPQSSYCNAEYGMYAMREFNYNFMCDAHIYGAILIKTQQFSIFTPQSIVIVARILRRSNRKINNHHIYKIDIVKTYKSSEKAQQYLKQSRLITAPSDGLCGINFSESS